MSFRILTCLVCCSYAGALFADACLKGLNGVPDVVECSYVQSSITELPFFASKVCGLDKIVISFISSLLFLNAQVHDFTAHFCAQC